MPRCRPLSDGNRLNTPARSCVGERPIAAEPTGIGTSEFLAGSTPNLHTARSSGAQAGVENRGMNFFAQHPRARWAAPVLAAALMVGGVATAQSSAGGQSDLAPRTAHDLLVDLQKARPTPLSGTVAQTMDLGLPDLSAGALSGGSGSAGKLNPVSLLSGSHSWRVWFADPTHARLALVDGTDEYDVVRNGSDVWQWSSADASVAHAKVPAEAENPGDTRSPATPGDRRRRHPRPVQPGCRRDLGAVPAGPDHGRHLHPDRPGGEALGVRARADASHTGHPDRVGAPLARRRARRSRSPLRSSPAAPPGPPWMSASRRSPWRGRRRPSSSSRRHPVPR